MKTAIVLGGTVPHVELVNQLKGRGYYTILVDYLDNPPAASVADEHIQESTLDQEKVLEIALERKADLVICGCVDQANITACYVMEKLGKKPPYSYDLAKKITNKGYMKKVMMENAIPTSRYYYIDDDSDMADIVLDYPVIVKPADCNSSKGVRKANDPAQMKEYLKDAILASRNKRAIVEEFVEGVEFSAYCFVHNKKAVLFNTNERLSVQDGEKKVIKCYASILPARIPEWATKRAEEIATRIAEVFELDNTPLFFQGIVKNGEVYVIEFAPRVAGGVSFSTILDSTGFDQVSAVIDSYLGIVPDMTHFDPKFSLVVNSVYGNDGIFDHAENYESLIEDGTIEHIYFHKKRGAVIDNSTATASRVCVFIIKVDSFEEALRKSGRVYSCLRLIDNEGNNMIRKDISICGVCGE